MKKYYIGLAAAMALSVGEYADNLFSDSVRRNSKGLQKPEPNIDSLEDHLSAKGLSVFVINGKRIIAHNEQEAQKRYRNRIKAISCDSKRV